MHSILQDDLDICFLCGLPAYGDPLDWHHVFGGALRAKSEKYGLKVRLHHSECHICGCNSAHQSGATAEYLHRTAQAAAMQAYGWTVADFRKVFYKNYL